MPANSKTKCDYDSQNGVMHPRWSHNMLTNAKCTYVCTYAYMHYMWTAGLTHASIAWSTHAETWKPSSTRSLKPANSLTPHRNHTRPREFTHLSPIWRMHHGYHTLSLLMRSSIKRNGDSISHTLVYRGGSCSVGILTWQVETDSYLWHRKGIHCIHRHWLAHIWTHNGQCSRWLPKAVYLRSLTQIHLAQLICNIATCLKWPGQSVLVIVCMSTADIVHCTVHLMCNHHATYWQTACTT